MEGYQVIEHYRVGRRSVVLLHNPAAEKPWCVMRSSPRYFRREELARSCLQCLLDHPIRCPKICRAGGE